MSATVTPLDSRTPSSQSQTSLGRLCGSETWFRDRYEILRVLGRGGFGVTFLARDQGLPGTPLCVIKQLCPKVDHPSALVRAQRRFEREAATLGQLGSHAQIPNLLDYFEHEGEFYLIQEYVRGQTLAKAIRKQGLMSEADVKQFLREILPVLSYIHQNHVIHRDIKPPNLIRSDDDGRLVLIDFGAVKEQIAAAEASAVQNVTQFVGTLGFAPAEQMALRPTYASDIFSLGMTCLYLLTGKPPTDFRYNSGSGEVHWRPLVKTSDYFGSILDKMLKTSLGDRFQSADEILRALDLEPHLDHLAHCMTVQSPTADGNAKADDYLAPFMRTAIAIRRWRTKRQAMGLI